jgi:thymidylate kinase
VLAARVYDAVMAYVRPPGRLWTMSGPDGGGKSSIADVFLAAASRRLVTGVTRYHTRPYVLPRLAFLVPIGGARRATLLGDRRYERPSVVRSVFRLVVLVADHQVGYWLRIRPRLARGELVLFDRHVADYLVDPAIRGINAPAFVLRAAAALVPRGHTHVYVLARPETLVSRKHELSAHETIAQVRGYAALAAGDRRALVLETDGLGVGDAARRLLERLRTETSQ